MARFKDRTGEKFITTEGYQVIVLKCFSAMNTTIKFNDWNNTILYKIPVQRLLNGMIKNPYHLSVHGTGYFGIGKYKTSYFNGKQMKSYTKWESMIERCYSEKELNKRPSYRGCKVDTKWHCFQVFAEWFDKNYIEGWELDKDIACKDCREYNPKNCEFVPQEINALFTNRKNHRGKYPIGVTKRGNRFCAYLSKEGTQTRLGTFDTPQEAFECYKFHKEKEIKRVADKWKPVITERIYKAMYDWKILITD